MNSGLIIIGAGGLAREAFDWVAHQRSYVVRGFYVDAGTAPQTIFAHPVFRGLGDHPYEHFLVAVEDIEYRQRLFDAAISMGLHPCHPIIPPSCIIGNDVRVGRGTLIAPATVISNGATIGQNTVIGAHSTIGYDCVISENVLLASGVHLGGGVLVQPKAFIGAGTVVRSNRVIGSGAMVGVGSVIVKDVTDGEVVMGLGTRTLASLQKTD